MPPRALVLIALLLTATPAWAWGPQGHQIVAAIAARELTPTARSRIGALLGGDAAAMMSLDSSWADDVRSDRPETSSWHYVDIEIGSRGYDAARDCPHGDCIVAQIARDSRLLADPRTARPLRIEALRFLIHFVADIHQPMHAVDRHDRGGNSLRVFLRGRRTNLHAVWDQAVVSVLGRDAGPVAESIRDGLTADAKMRMKGGAPADWATESFHRAAQDIYARLPDAGFDHTGPVSLPDDYAGRQSGMVREQLARAGLRLGTLLNRLFAR